MQISKIILLLIIALSSLYSKDIAFQNFKVCRIDSYQINIEYRLKNISNKVLYLPISYWEIDDNLEGNRFWTWAYAPFLINHLTIYNGDSNGVSWYHESCYTINYIHTKYKKLNPNNNIKYILKLPLNIKNNPYNLKIQFDLPYVTKKQYHNNKRILKYTTYDIVDDKILEIGFEPKWGDYFEKYYFVQVQEQFKNNSPYNDTSEDIRWKIKSEYISITKRFAIQ